MAKYKTIPIEILHQLLICDPVVGTLTWRTRPREFFPSDRSMKWWNTMYAGRPALACVNSIGYCVGAILGENFLAHRVIFAMSKGRWPKNEVDHEFGRTADNTFSQMRDVTHRQNCRNQRRAKTNTSGVTGVCWAKREKKWLSRIKAKDREIFLGYFNKKTEAIAARKQAEREYGFHPNHGRLS